MIGYWSSKQIKDKNKFGIIVAEAMAEKGISWNELSKRSRTTRQNLYHMTVNTMPNFSKVCAVCYVLGLDAETVWQKIHEEDSQ